MCVWGGGGGAGPSPCPVPVYFQAFLSCVDNWGNLSQKSLLSAAISNIISDFRAFATECLHAAAEKNVVFSNLTEKFRVIDRRRKAKNLLGSLIFLQVCI